MAKKVEKDSKAKQPTLKDKIYDVAGMALAVEFSDYDVIKVKPVDVTEGILVDAEGKHFYITITEKKKAVEYEDEDIRRNYTNEANAENGENEE